MRRPDGSAMALEAALEILEMQGTSPAGRLQVMRQAIRVYGNGPEYEMCRCCGGLWCDDCGSHFPCDCGRHYTEEGE